MDNGASDPVPVELQVWMDTEIQIEGLAAPGDQPKLEQQLLALPGVDSVSIARNKVAIRYNPEKITKARLGESIMQAGFRVADAASAPASPPIQPPREK